MARRLRLTLNHFAFLAQQFVVFRDHRQRRAVVFFVTLFIAQQRTPACFGQETRFGDKPGFGNLQFDNAFAEHGVGTKLHQILTSHQLINLRLVFGQINVAGARRRDYRMVGIDFFIIPAAVTRLQIHGRLREQIRRVDTNRVQHRVTPGKVFFRQITAI